MLKYHLVKITTTPDNQIVATRILTRQPRFKRQTIRYALTDIATCMQWPHAIQDFAKQLRLDTRPSQIDLDELCAVNWEPRLLMPESKLRWAAWKLLEDGRYTVPGYEPGDNYGIQTYLLAKID